MAPPLPCFGPAATPLVVRRHPRARVMRLAVDPRDGGVRLTLPRRAALGPALVWVEGKRAWIETQIGGAIAPRPFAPGVDVPLGDAVFRIDWQAGALRRPVLDETAGLLRVGGPLEAVNTRVERWLRQEARTRFEARTQAIADHAGVTVSTVSVGDPRTRWGSCSSSGAIRYSWRLILAPDAVQEATVAHEVAHRLHMHHGPAFHAAVRRLLGRDPSAERAWLAANGAGLYGFGRLS